MRLRGVWAACVALLACVGAGQALAADRLAWRIQASGQVLVRIWPDYYGISLRDPRTLQLAGIDIDLAHELAHELGVAVQFVDSSFARLVTDVQAERCDVAMFAIGITPQRQQVLRFHPPVSGQRRGGHHHAQQPQNPQLGRHRPARHCGGRGQGHAARAFDARAPAARPAHHPETPTRANKRCSRAAPTCS